MSPKSFEIRTGVEVLLGNRALFPILLGVDIEPVQVRYRRVLEEIAQVTKVSHLRASP